MAARSVFLSPLSSIPFLLVRPSVLALAAAPILLGLLIFPLLMWGGWELLAEPALARISTESEKLDRFLRFIAGMFVVASLFIACGLSSILLTIPLGAPFLDKASELIEQEILARRPDLMPRPLPLAVSIRHAIFEGLRRASVALPIIFVVLALNFIPVIGPLLALAAGLANAAYFLPIDAMSYSMDRRRWKFRRKLAWMRDHRDIWRPLGIGLGLAALIPCNLLWFPALAAVSGTRLFCARLLEEHPSD